MKDPIRFASATKLSLPELCALLIAVLLGSLLEPTWPTQHLMAMQPPFHLETLVRFDRAVQPLLLGSIARMHTRPPAAVISNTDFASMETHAITFTKGCI